MSPVAPEDGSIAIAYQQHLDIIIKVIPSLRMARKHTHMLFVPSDPFSSHQKLMRITTHSHTGNQEISYLMIIHLT
jgi:hypothetical protein